MSMMQTDPVVGSTHVPPQMAPPDEGSGTCFNILILEDDPFEQARLKRDCRATGLPVTTTVATDLKDFEAALDLRAYDVVLIDYLLPDGDGLAAQRLVQNHPVNFAAAMVMISANMQKEVALASMKRGSMDCVDKDSLDAAKLRDLMIASAKVFAEASRHWIGELLAQQRVQITQDIAKGVRNESQFGRFIDTIDRGSIDGRGARGLTKFEH